MAALFERPPIFLVGMMGAGKSTVGRALAQLLDVNFVDLDRELENRCGVSIPCIFETEGEEGFRRRETQLLREYLAKTDIVVATGGGVVTRDENRLLLKTSPAIAIHLKVCPEQCYERTRLSDRPLLQCEDPMEKIRNLISARTPLYEEVSTLSYDTDGITPVRAARELKERLDQQMKEEKK